MRISDWSSDVCSSDLLRLHGDDERLSGLEQIPVLVQAFGKQHGLELAGGIGKSDDAHLVASARLALLPSGHRSRQTAGRRTLFYGEREIGKVLDTQLCERCRIGIERVRRQIGRAACGERGG